MSDNRAEMMERLMEMETTLPFPWGAVARAAHDEIERLQAVVDAVRSYLRKDSIRDYQRMESALRALDGGVKPCSRCGGTGKVQLEPKFEYPKPWPCPVCHGEVKP